MASTDAGPVVFILVGGLLSVYLVMFYVLYKNGEELLVEISDSLDLNLKIFGFGVIWWLLEPITNCARFLSWIWLRMKRLTGSFRTGRSERLLHETLDEDSPCAPPVAANEQKNGAMSLARKLTKGIAPSNEPLENSSICNYLMYLQVNVYIFFALSLINSIFAWAFDDEISMFSGVVPNALIGDRQQEGSAINELTLQIAKWVLDGVVILAGTRLIIGCTQVTLLNEQQADQIKRTVWMQKLPRKDRLTRATFALDDQHFKDVEFALTRSINESVNNEMTISKVWTEAERDDAIEELKRRGYIVDIPQEPLRQSGAKASGFQSAVEECQVVPVLDTWEQAQERHERAEENVKSIQKKITEDEEDLQSLQRDTTLFAGCRRCRKRVDLRVHLRKREKYKNEKEASEKVLEKQRGYPKNLSGSAFVTFKRAQDCEQILATHCCEQRTMSLRYLPRMVWDFVTSPQGYSYFRFGRPPFGSVTLRCSRAPPPSDIEWKNLHVPENQSRIFVGCLGFCLLLFVFVFVAPFLAVILSGRLVTYVTTEADLLLNRTQSLPFDNSTKYFITEVIETVQSPIVTGGARQVPTILLTVINTGILPSAIEAIGLIGKSRQKSLFEVGQKSANYWFIVFNVIVLPMLGMSAIEVTLSGGKDNAMLQSVQRFTEDMPDMMTNLQPINTMGPYGMKYVMNSAFLSSITQLLDVAQTFFRWTGKFFVTTEREVKDLYTPWPFAWGYWYGWTLSIYTLVVILGCIVPSIFPMAAVFFFVKFLVDRHNLLHNVYDGQQSEMEGRLVLIAARDMRAVVAVCWFLEGVAIIASKTLHMQFTRSYGHNLAKGAGIVLVAMAIVLFAWSYVSFGTNFMSLHTMPTRNDSDLTERRTSTALRWLRYCCCYRRRQQPAHGMHIKIGRLLGLPTLIRQERFGSDFNVQISYDELTWNGARMLNLKEGNM